VRRLLVLCTPAVMILSAFSALHLYHVTTVSAASGSSNLTLFGEQPLQAGCSLGPDYTFCDQVPGTTGSTVVFFVDNSTAVSAVSVSLQAIPGVAFKAGDFTITSNSCTGSLAANAQCDIGVAFSPTLMSAGLRGAALTVTDAQGDVLGINIEGTAKQLAIAPTSDPCTLPDNAYNYCSEPIGGTSPAANFTVAAGSGGATGLNASLAPISGLQSEFAPGDFTITANGCTGALPVNGNCTVSVEFTPTAAGLRSAALTATDSNGDSTTIYLAGATQSGLFFDSTEPGPNPATCERVNFYGFCSEPVGGTSAANTFTLVNTSGAQITGLSIPAGSATSGGANPDFAVKSTTCTSTLPATSPNNSCTITVAFTPQEKGLRQGEIVVTDAEGDVAGLNFIGVGDDYELQLASGQTSELSVVQGQGGIFTGQIVSDGVFGQNSEQVSFTCPINLPQFTSCQILIGTTQSGKCPASVSPASPTPFEIIFVTSSVTSEAPVPTAQCSGYGLPASSGGLVKLPDGGLTSRPMRPISKRILLSSIALLFAILAAVFRTTKRIPLLVPGLLATVLIMAVLAGCHHSSPPPLPVTPLGATAMSIQGMALDNNGDPLNATRGLVDSTGNAEQIILDVVQ